MSGRKRSSQPYEIKGVDALFGTVEPTETSDRSLPLAAIIPSEQQPRRYLDPEKLNHLVESVKQHGILEPLLVRPGEKGKYQLIAGERRYRAATILGLSEVPVVIRNFDDQEALQVALVENLQREDLNPVEETEGILDLVALRIKKQRDDVITLLNQAAHPDRNCVDNVIHTKEWQILQEVFDAVGRFTPESFRTNRLPLLNLPNDVLEALRQGKLEYTKARVLSRVKDETQRGTLLNLVISKSLSLNEIKQQVEEIRASQKASKNPEQSEETLKQEFSSRLSEVNKLLKKGKIWADSKKRQKAEKLLAELAKLVDN